MKDWDTLMSEVSAICKDTGLSFTLKKDYYFGEKFMALFVNDVEDYVNGVSETSFKEATNNAILNYRASELAEY